MRDNAITLVPSSGRVIVIIIIQARHVPLLKQSDVLSHTAFHIHVARPLVGILRDFTCCSMS